MQRIFYLLAALLICAPLALTGFTQSPGGLGFKDGVKSLNGGSGKLTIAGAGSVSVSRTGQTILITGAGNDIESTDDVPEGDNLYYTDERVIDAMASLTTADLPNDLITFSKMQNISSARVLGRTDGGSGDIQELTVGSNMTISGGQINATATVTGVGLIMPDDFSVNSSPITSFGSLGVNWVNVSEKLFLAGPTSGSADDPDFRAIASADIATALLTPGPIGTTTPGVIAHAQRSSAVAILSANTSLDITHNVIVGDVTATRSFTLPLANSANGRSLEYILIKADATGGLVRFLPSGSDTINGAGGLSLTVQYESATVRSDGVDKWYVVSRFTP
jgi:hypothetical protein